MNIKQCSRSAFGWASELSFAVAIIIFASWLPVAAAQEKKTDSKIDEVEKKLEDAIEKFSAIQNRLAKQIREKLEKDAGDDPIDERLFLKQFQEQRKAEFKKLESLNKQFDEAVEKWLDYHSDKSGILGQTLTTTGSKDFERTIDLHANHAFNAYSKVMSASGKIGIPKEGSDEYRAARTEFLEAAEEWYYREVGFRKVHLGKAIKKKCESADTLLRMIALLFLLENESQDTKIFEKKILPIANKLMDKINEGGKKDSPEALDGAAKMIKEIWKSSLAVNVKLSAAKVSGKRLADKIEKDVAIKNVLRLGMCVESLRQRKSIADKLDKKQAEKLDRSLKIASRLLQELNLRRLSADKDAFQLFREVLVDFDDLQRTVRELHAEMVPLQFDSKNPKTGAIRSRAAIAVKCLELVGDKEEAKAIKNPLK